MTARTALYYGAIDLFPAFTTEQQRVYFDKQEASRFDRMRPEVGKRFFWGRKLAKDALAKRLGCSPGGMTFSYTANGKPFLLGEPCHFSISHCSTAVAVAISDCNIGVDLEQLERRSGKLEPPWLQPENFLHPLSAALVEAASSSQEKARLFMLLWTLMESQVKLFDSGIHRVIKTLAIDLNSHTQPAELRVLAGERCFWRSYNKGLAQGTEVLSVASHRQLPKPELHIWQQGGLKKVELEPDLESVVE
ncbi:4'-phosphopantetheinyl transferase [Alteromonadaceae bacterium Bs31]|nr:4'-phosphopantetheinyl transferase [Alteromonadaceae bacterium Bs31]